MQYTKDSHIQNMAEVTDFFHYLANDCNLFFHPDTKFEEYMKVSDGVKMPAFTPGECEMYNRLMSECFTVSIQAGVDLYHLGLKTLREASGINI